MVSKRHNLPALAGLAFLVALIGCGSPAQIGIDDDVRNTVDALFTALTSKDTQRLDQCERELTALKQAGKLPANAAQPLERIIQQARGDDWEGAAKRLYRFIDGQRGEPVAE